MSTGSQALASINTREEPDLKREDWDEENGSRRLGIKMYEGYEEDQ